MTHKIHFIFVVGVIIILLSACGSVQTPPSPVESLLTDRPDNQFLGNTQDTWEPSTMYPMEDTQIATLYPAWDRPKVKFEELNPPIDAPEPLEGKASISGLLYAFDISVPLANIEFILVPAVITEGTPIVPPIITNGDPESGDIIGKTDANGVFYLNDVAPGLYYLLINYPDHSVIAVESDNTLYNRLLEFEANESYLLGVIKILG